jgi:aspartate-semialdehyde dehydrogenase
MLKLGFVGWRGMVGSVLMERMLSNRDFDNFKTFFFSASTHGQKSPEFPNSNQLVLDSFSIEDLVVMDVIVTTQGSEYTLKMHSRLREAGWNGYWVDAASALRMRDSSFIPLDPVNHEGIVSSIKAGVRDFVGGNCSITLNLIALSGLLRSGNVDWISSMTYQAASGAGAANMNELLDQMDAISHVKNELHASEAMTTLDVDKKVLECMRSSDFPQERFGLPLAGSLIPWIDEDLGNGVSKEEWKGDVEASKILGISNSALRVDGLCVRVGSMRSHASALTIKLNKDIDIREVERLITSGNAWVHFVPNNKKDTLEFLTPVNASGKDKVFIGRLRKLSVDPHFITAFTVGDQLIWGAAEPLRRMLGIISDQESIEHDK